MRLKTPSFWYNQDSIKARLIMLLLLPFSLIYFIGHRLHHAFVKPYKAEIPIICIGNLTTGGSGKTPVALSIMSLIENNNIALAPAFLTRGYGGAEKGPLFVNPDKHLYKDVGDEPLLLARKAPTIVSRNRKAGAERAVRKHDLLIMDDGLQNPTLTKTLSFIVIDGKTGFGNGHMIPAGPLRQPLADGLEQASAFIIIGDDERNVTKHLPENKPVFKARLKVPEGWVSHETQNYVAFTGLGHPQKFYDSLRERGLSLEGWHIFPDHYPYTQTDLEKMDQEAKDHNARLITTEKDAVRIPADTKLDSKLDIMPIAIEWHDKSKVKDFLNQYIKSKT